MSFGNFHFKKIYYLLSLILCFTLNSFGQVDYFKFTGTKKDYTDTLAKMTSEQLSKESAGLLEREIDPDSYIVGPNDGFVISISGYRPIEFNSMVLPDGSLLINGVGAVNLKGKTLNESINIIKNKIKKIYKIEEIDVLLNQMRKFKVIVTGAISKVSSVPATAVDRVSEVIEKAGGFKFGASLRNIMLFRNDSLNPIRVDLIRFFLLGDKSSNPTVLGGDRILISQLYEKNNLAIYGEVLSPGTFEFNPGDSLSTLVRFGHGFTNSAFLDSVEIDRYSPKNDSIIRFYININSWKNELFTNTNLSSDIPLFSGDRVYIRSIPLWHKSNYIVIKGCVNYPGTYAIDENHDKVSDLISRVGGFTDDASLESIEFIRQQELEKNDKEMERLSKIPSNEMSKSEFRYFQAKKGEKVGVMAIDFKKIIRDPTVNDNIFLHNKDSIIVPSKKDYINVQGRVNNPGLIVYNKNLNYLGYVELAGGFGYRSDPNETFIVKSKGEIFLANNFNYTIDPGDNILVPPEKETSGVEVFTTILTVFTQLITITGVVLTIVRLK